MPVHGVWQSTSETLLTLEVAIEFLGGWRLEEMREKDESKLTKSKRLPSLDLFLVCRMTISRFVMNQSMHFNLLFLFLVFKTLGQAHKNCHAESYQTTILLSRCPGGNSQAGDTQYVS